ncbi:hypothetical protein BOX15_Mlig007238g1 [Macrostomum lignano]|uniref:Uncharacterized protein n=1 Tax=Macrostomum lignano TaxID=282301 RepID=A0A267EB72_9PLAT|nr:hypothetical protein BOX15_Mlig007238g1 [Macrostomum lignano]
MRQDERYLSAYSGCVCGPAVVLSGAAAIVAGLRHTCVRCNFVVSVAISGIAILLCCGAAFWLVQLFPGKNEKNYVGPEGSVSSPTAFRVLYIRSAVLLLLVIISCLLQLAFGVSHIRTAAGCVSQSDRPRYQVQLVPHDGAATQQPAFQVQLQPLGGFQQQQPLINCGGDSKQPPPATYLV